MRLTLPLRNFQGVAAGGVAHVDLPIGRRIHSVDLLYATLTDLEEIRVIVNGNVVQRATAARINTMNQFFGYTAAGATTGILRLFFDRPGISDLPSAQATAFNTAIADQDGVVITSVRIEVDIASGATSPTLEGYYESSFNDGAISGRRHAIRYIMPRTEPSLISGENQLFDLPRGNSTQLALDQLFMWPSANDIGIIEIHKNTNLLFDRTKALNERIQADGNGAGSVVRAPQSSLHVVDRTERGSIVNSIGLSDATTFEVRLTTTGTMSLDLYFVTLGRVQG